MYSPIFFLAYNRPDYTRQILDRIYSARPKYLYIVIDYEDSPEHSEVVRICESARLRGDCKVSIYRNYENLGCKYSTLRGLDIVFQNHDRVIMIEDDTLPLTDFFIWCDKMLTEYKDNTAIWQVSGNNMHNIPFENHYGFSKFPCCWGWGTWRNRWERYKEHSPEHIYNVLPYYLGYDLKRRLKLRDQWDYNWLYTILLHNGLCITPKYNMVDNISESGLNIKRKWHVPNIRPIESLETIEYTYPHRDENYYYFVSQFKQKIYNVLSQCHLLTL